MKIYLPEYESKTLFQRYTNMLLFHNNKGFSLTELMVVVAIVGIMGVVAIASFGTWFASNRIEGAASQLLAEMNLARMKAISENNDYIITFDGDDHEYSIYDDDDNDGAEAAELVKTVEIQENFSDIEFGFVATTLKVDNTTALSDALSFTSVTFEPTGLSDAGTIYLAPDNETKKSLQRAIDVNVAGRIKLYIHNGTIWE